MKSNRSSSRVVLDVAAEVASMARGPSLAPDTAPAAQAAHRRLRIDPWLRGSLLSRRLSPLSSGAVLFFIRGFFPSSPSGRGAWKLVSVSGCQAISGFHPF